MAEGVFWLAACIVLYTYLGYPLVLAILRKRRQTVLPGALPWPQVTVIIAAYNEGAVIAEKLQNTLGLHDPAGQLRIVVVADGSNDNTVQLVQQYEGVELLYQPQRMGKAAALNRALEQVQQGIVIITDANTQLNNEVLLAISAPFADPTVGGVAGAKKVYHAQSAASGEGWYWRYESALKQLESDFYTVVGAAGELFAFRRELFQPIPAAAITDDFYISVRINQQHYRIVYAPLAISTEAPSLTLQDEWNRKVRIAAGGFQSLRYFFNALNFFRYPALAFQFFSHRVLRWVFCAPALVLLFLASMYLCFCAATSFFIWIFAAQCIFYLAAGAGFLLARGGHPAPFFLQVPFYFVLMHAALPVGWWRLASGKQSALWQKARRHHSAH